MPIQNRPSQAGRNFAAPRPALRLAIWLIVPLLLASPAGAVKKKKPDPDRSHAVLWIDPGDISAKNLFYGAGGKEGGPRPPFTFVKEDGKGASPKFEVRDAGGIKWKAKLGDEAQPEVVASRLLWATGYFANINYLASDAEVQGLPHLRRGQQFIDKDGRVRQMRLQRTPDKKEKEGNWSWRHNPFKGTREFNGLRVMMALISNWDLKDDNNAILADEVRPGIEEYEVSDVGTSFGMSGKSYTDALSKNNLEKYRHSRFVTKVTPTYVDIDFPTHPPFFYIFHLPLFVGRLSYHWVGRHIPREDAKWAGSLLSQLSTEQMRDAFRAANYSPQQVEAFTEAVKKRIAELSRL